MGRGRSSTPGSWSMVQWEPSKHETMPSLTTHDDGGTFLCNVADTSPLPADETGASYSPSVTSMTLPAFAQTCDYTSNRASYDVSRNHPGAHAAYASRSASGTRRA
jgi:hypothetical protein